jgi:hypothetical protein
MATIGSGSLQRLDRHNPEIDDDAAEAGLCGMTHLPTGRRCLLPLHHVGSCVFQDATVSAIAG